MATRVERLDALQKALDDYTSKEKKRIENEVKFLKAVLKGRTGQETVSRTVDVISEAAYKDVATYLFGDADVAFGTTPASTNPGSTNTGRPPSTPTSPGQDTGGAAPPGVMTVAGWENGVEKSIVVMLADFETSKYLSVPAANAYILMKIDAARSGVHLSMNLGFRTYAEQQYYYQLYLSGRGSPAARPGYSNHQMGIAADIHVVNRYSAQYTWLHNNAARFHFVNTENPNIEPWHWEYRP